MKDLTHAELEALEAEAAYYDQQAREQSQREAIRDEVLSSLTAEDLMKDCPKCQGYGWIDNPSWPDGPESLLCPECDGSRKILTPAGEAIAALCRHIYSSNEAARGK